MATNGTEIATETRLEEEILRIQRADHGTADKAPVRRRPVDNRVSEADYFRAAGAEAAEAGDDFALAPLVDKIAYGIARGLIVAVKELENHIASETRKVGDAVGRRLDTFQVNLDDLSRFVGEQRTTNGAVQGQLQELSAGLRETNVRQESDAVALRQEAREATASLQESDARQAAALGVLATETKAAQQEAEVRHTAALTALTTETRASSQAITERVDGLCKELGVQQEDVAALKTTLVSFSSRVDALVERLDRQADAVRSMCTAYSQRENELEQLVSGLARLRAFPTPLAPNAL